MGNSLKKMKYTIIIATMYFHIKQLYQMLVVYNAMDCIGEILLVNNNEDSRFDFNLDKIRVIGTGVNQYVNPSWKLGATEAKYENIIIANDDILLKGDVETLFLYIADRLKGNSVFGPSKRCFAKYKVIRKLGCERARTASKYRMNYGYGVLMFTKRSTFLNTAIPDDFLVWYGDHLLFAYNQPWEFTGIEIETDMKGTTSKLDLSGFAEKEREAFTKLTVQNGK